MNNQSSSGCGTQGCGDLFNQQVKKLHHRNDPDTSKIAAEKFVKAGKLNSWHERILHVLRMFPSDDGHTCMELAYIMADESHEDEFRLYHAISRRMNELKAKGAIESCGKRETRRGGGLRMAYRKKEN